MSLDQFSFGISPLNLKILSYGDRSENNVKFSAVWFQRIYCCGVNNVFKRLVFDLCSVSALISYCTSENCTVAFPPTLKTDLNLEICCSVPPFLSWPPTPKLIGREPFAETKLPSWSCWTLDRFCKSVNLLPCADQYKGKTPQNALHGTFLPRTFAFVIFFHRDLLVGWVPIFVHGKFWPNSVILSIFYCGISIL